MAQMRADSMYDSSLRTVERAFSLLQHVVLEQQVIGTRETARNLGISPSTALRLLRTLAGLGLLEKDPTTHAYGPGLELYRLAATLLASGTLTRAARRPMERIAKQTGESAHLCVRHGDHRLVLDTVPGWHQLSYALPIGDEAPLHVGSSGQAILAWLPEEEVDSFIRKGLVTYTPRTITDPEELRRTLRVVRAQGFAISSGQHGSDGVGVSAPIFRTHGEVMGSLLVTIPQTRLHEHGPLPEFGRMVRRVADEISLHLGGRSESESSDPQGTTQEGEAFPPWASPQGLS
ncbi:MAG: IclR family transcriptional regulator [Anaerolineae bacterium]